MANTVTTTQPRIVPLNAQAVNQASQFVHVTRSAPNSLWAQPTLGRSAFFQANASRPFLPGLTTQSFQVAPQLAPLANRPAVSFLRGVWDQYHATRQFQPRSVSVDLPQSTLRAPKPITFAPREVELSLPAVQIPLQINNRAPFTTRASDIASANIFIDVEPTTPTIRPVVETSSLPTGSAITSKILTTALPVQQASTKARTAEPQSTQTTQAAADTVALSQTANQHASTQHTLTTDKAAIAADSAHTAFTLKAADVAQLLMATTLQPASDLTSKSPLSHANLITSAAERAQFSPKQIAATYVLARLIQNPENQIIVKGRFLQEIRQVFAELGVLEVFVRTIATRQTARSLTRSEISAKSLLAFIVREIIEKRQLNGLLYRGEEADDEETLYFDDNVARKDLSNSTNPNGGDQQQQHQHPQHDN